jgi:hypothetical protein
MKVLSPKKGFYQFSSRYVYLGMGNAFLYTDRANDPDVIKTLNLIYKRLTNMK